MSATRKLIENRIFDDINVTPMLDVAYVLLIIFIIMTTATVQGIMVDLPQASKSQSLQKPKTKAVTITNDGTIYLDTYPVTLPELEARLASAKAADPELPVVIKAAGEVAYQKVVDVMDLTSKLNITKLGLVTTTVAQ